MSPINPANYYMKKACILSFLASVFNKRKIFTVFTILCGSGMFSPGYKSECTVKQFYHQQSTSYSIKIHILKTAINQKFLHLIV